VEDGRRKNGGSRKSGKGGGDGGEEGLKAGRKREGRWGGCYVRGERGRVRKRGGSERLIVRCKGGAGVVGEGRGREVCGSETRGGGEGGQWKGEDEEKERQVQGEGKRGV